MRPIILSILLTVATPYTCRHHEYCTVYKGAMTLCESTDVMARLYTVQYSLCIQGSWRVSHDSFMYRQVTRNIQRRDIETRVTSHTRHTGLMHMCDMTLVYRTYKDETYRRESRVIRDIHDSCICVTWLSSTEHTKTRHTDESHESYETYMTHAYETYRRESCHTYAWVMSHICMSHVTHVNSSSHTYECVVSHTHARAHTRTHTHIHNTARLGIHTCIYIYT